MEVDLQALVFRFADRVDTANKEVDQGAFADVMADSNIPESAGGRMPVLTGELRNSITVNGVMGVRNWRAGLARSVDGKNVGEYRARHAPYLEFGTSRGIAPRVFMRGAILKRNQFLSRRAKAVR